MPNKVEPSYRIVISVFKDFPDGRVAVSEKLIEFIEWKHAFSKIMVVNAVVAALKDVDDA